MLITWLEALRHIPETSIYLGISVVRENKTKAFHPRKKRGGSGLTESTSDQAEECNGRFTDVVTLNKFNEVPLLGRSAQ